MNIDYLIGDATRPRGDGNKIICHVCNDVGGWGAGFVLALSARWAAPEKEYRAWYKARSTNDFALGAVQLVEVEEQLWVANIIGQRDVRTSSAGPPVRYDAMASGLATVGEFALERQASVHMPRIGCGLAGGTWDKVGAIVERVLASQGVAVTVYDL